MMNFIVVVKVGIKLYESKNGSVECSVRPHRKGGTVEEIRC